ncbi:MAG: flippase-like domain-containing protein [Gemmatimonadetes bacterium]|nr:flippase-like domain-containing protein [Gemmatimonadota bacterium]
MKGKNRWLRPAVGLVVAGAFVYLAFGKLDWSSIQATLRSARPFPLLVGLAALAAGFGVRIVRWWWMLRALEPSLPLQSCARPFLLSLAVNNTVPLRAGDLVRAFGFGDTLRSPPMRVLATLVVERMLDAFVLLALFFVGLLGVAAGALPVAFVTTGVVLGVACLAGILVLILAPYQLQRVAMRLLRVPILARHPSVGRVGVFVEQFFGGLSILESPVRAVQLLGLSLLAWLLEGAMFAAVAWSLAIDGSPMAPWFALATGTLATLLPSSPGYVGTFDYFAMLGLTAYGASRLGAAAFALLVHLMLWLPVTLVGAVYLVAPRGRIAWRRSQQIAEST